MARLPTLEALKAAVRLSCVKYVEKRLASLNPDVAPGDRLFDALRRWDTDKQEQLEAMLDLTPLNAACDAFSKLRVGLEAVEAYVAPTESDPEDHPPIGYAPAPLLRSIASECRDLLARVKQTRSQPIEMTPRFLLVAEFDRSHCWWWGDEHKPRDLAVLSLLAGNWPERSVKKPEDFTPTQIIEQEERAIRGCRDRLRPNREKVSAPRRVR